MEDLIFLQVAMLAIHNRWHDLKHESYRDDRDEEYNELHIKAVIASICFFAKTLRDPKIVASALQLLRLSLSMFACYLYSDEDHDKRSDLERLNRLLSEKNVCGLHEDEMDVLRQGVGIVLSKKVDAQDLENALKRFRAYNRLFVMEVDSLN